MLLLSRIATDNMPRKRDSIKYGVRSSASSPSNYTKHGSKGYTGIILGILALFLRIPAKALFLLGGSVRATWNYHRNSK